MSHHRHLDELWETDVLRMALRYSTSALAIEFNITRHYSVRGKLILLVIGIGARRKYRVLLVRVYSTLANGRSGPPPNMFLYSLHSIGVWPWGKLSAHHFGCIYRGLAPRPQSDLPINSILVLYEGPLVRVHNLTLLAAVVGCIEAIGHRTGVQTAITCALFVIQVIFLELLSNLRRIPSR